MNVIRSLVVALLLSLAVLPGASASAAVPRSFFGVMADGPLLDGRAKLGPEMKLMRSSNVGSIRAAFYWRTMQPLRNTAVNFEGTDPIVAAAAQAGLDVMPVLVRAPSWATGGNDHTGAVPKDPQDYARFTADVARRYGPGGTFWAENPAIPARPIRTWQIWNEPDIQAYWLDQPFDAGYVELLRAAKTSIEQVDPGATIVMAGLTNRSWEALPRLYRRGAKDAFDVAAIHPFSKRVQNVAKIVRLVRAAMAKHGDADKPLMLSEVSWSSGKGRSTHNFGWEETEEGQADRVREVLPMLARMRAKSRLAGVFWYTWLSPTLGSADSFNYSGLRRLQRGGKTMSKPALRAFTKTVAKLVR